MNTFNRHHSSFNTLLKFGSVLVLMFSASCAVAASDPAEIVMLVGKGEHHDSASTEWIPATVNHKLQGGAFVRTLANSQMGILMTDRTQIRLNQNSQMQIKSVADSAQWTQTTVKLNAGRAWSQARPQTAQAAPVKTAKLAMETPSTIMSIRGTDWEVEVAPDGRTQLVVLSGQVLMGNDFGSVEVGRGEAAVAEVGKAPVKLVLINPASRVQWVSSWKPQPARWAGTDASRFPRIIEAINAGDHAAALNSLKSEAGQDAVAALLAADLLIAQGDGEGAVATLMPHANPGNTRAIALLAYALIRVDRLSEAENRLTSALADTPASVDLLLARGELALLQGDAGQARNSYHAVIQVEPDNPDAWYGLGLIESERENIRQARVILGKVMEKNPSYSKAGAELASAETFSGNYATAEKILLDVLQREPDNYIALTALGLNRLKNGHARQALDDFMKAGLIEPRYARAWLYSGVAFYQLDERARALQAFQKAAELDAKDPVPHLLQSMVDTDDLAYGSAIISAHQAQERMPYLKSVNQVVNNQKGSANLGSSLANFGMEDWASYYANESESPYWAGSHLFRADRYTGQFNKNSELFSGYLTDPTAFGASNRNSSLVPTPGHYRKVEAYVERNNWLQGALIGTLNGLAVDPIPMAYFVSGDLSTAEANNDDSSASGRNLTLGLGMKPRYDLGLFLFATDTKMDGDLQNSSLANDRLDQNEHRADFGINYKREPDNQFWLKLGGGQQDSEVFGTFVSPSIATSLNSAFAPTVFSPNGRLDKFGMGINQSDIQFRHAFSSGPMEWTWGMESSYQRRTGGLTATFAPVRLNFDEKLEVRAYDAYFSGKYRAPAATEAQLDVFAQHTRIHRTNLETLDILSVPATLTVEDSHINKDYSEVNPRLGIKWHPSQFQSLSIVGQQWRRPASASSLSAVDTLGIAVNDRLPSAGGYYERGRVQYEREFSGKAFFQAFYDYEHVDNGVVGRRTTLSDFEMSQLENLRSRPEVFSPRADVEETPIFEEGRVNTIGLASNFLINSRQSLAVRYLWRDSEQSGTNSGQDIPYIPRNYLQINSQWSFPDRWLLGASAIYRDHRFRDDTNLDKLSAGWSFGLTAYWESLDKRSSVQGVVDNILPNSDAGLLPHPHVMLRYSYRF